MGNNGTAIKNYISSSIQPISSISTQIQDPIIMIRDLKQKNGLIKNWIESTPDVSSLKIIQESVVEPVSDMLQNANRIATKANFNLRFFNLISAAQREEATRQYSSYEMNRRNVIAEEKKKIKEDEYNLSKTEEKKLFDDATSKCALAGLSFDPNNLNIGIFEKENKIQNIPQAVKENKIIDFFLVMINGGIIAACLASILPFIDQSLNIIYDPIFYAFYLAGIGITLSLGTAADRTMRIIYPRLIDPDITHSKRDTIVGSTVMVIFSILQLSEILLESYAIYSRIQEKILELARQGEVSFAIPVYIIILIGIILSNSYIFRKLVSAHKDLDVAREIRKRFYSSEVREAKEAVMKAIKAKEEKIKLENEIEQITVNNDDITEKQELARIETCGTWKTFTKELDKIVEEFDTPKMVKSGITTKIKNFIKSIVSWFKNIKK